MKKSEELYVLRKQRKKVLIILPLVFLISVLVLFVMGQISQKHEIAYNEVNVTVNEVIEKRVRRARRTSREVEVRVDYQGNSYQLYGVTIDERQKYKESLETGEDIIVYECNNKLFSSVSALKGTTVLGIMRVVLFYCAKFSGLGFIFFILAYIIDTIQYKKVLIKEEQEEKEERERALKYKNVRPPVKRPKNIPNAIKNSAFEASKIKDNK